jgi:hypothetical protein
MEKPLPATSTSLCGSALDRQDARSQPHHDSHTDTRSLSPNEDRHLLNLVDLLDEVVLLKKASSTGEQSLEIVESRIQDLILLSDGEIIRDLVWNPDRQRAVEVIKGENPGITLLSSRSSGLIIKGRVVKKEEVVIEKNTNS